MQKRVISAILRLCLFLRTPGMALVQPNCYCKPVRIHSTRPRCRMQGTNDGSFMDVFQGDPYTLMDFVWAAVSYETAVQGCCVSFRAFDVLMPPAFKALGTTSKDIDWSRPSIRTKFSLPKLFHLFCPCLWPLNLSPKMNHAEPTHRSASRLFTWFGSGVRYAQYF